MYFLMGLFALTVLIIGINYCVLLIGGVPFQSGAEFKNIKFGHKTYTVERLTVIVSSFIFGLSGFFVWTHFLFTKWDSIFYIDRSLILLIALHYVASIALVTSSIGLTLQWRIRTKMFWISMGALLTSCLGLILALSCHGERCEPMFLYLFSASALVIGGFLATVTYLLDGWLHIWDERLTAKRRLHRSRP